ncbi:MAG: hypothetical protein V4632_01990 [Pseudomonadota bacterium]
MVLCGYNAASFARTCSACHIARRLSRDAMTNFPENGTFKTGSFDIRWRQAGIDNADPVFAQNHAANFITALFSRPAHAPF